ncbi:MULTISPECIES: PTS sugar transporter subunit IIA [Listeria]|uniref:PTS sugar transporter subunit IIA n=1 Tax=Listeria TaxID=1637 RepID=UPI000B594649|nr:MULTISPECIES: PTS sugar transporter subunit IIA [Listeria]
MTAIFVCTHGNAAEELIRSAEMICGTQKNTSFVPFEVGETPENLQSKIMQEISNLNVEEGVLFLTDLKGGTPFNVLVTLLLNFSQTELVTGVNIPLLLEAFINRESLPLNVLANQIIEAGKQGVYQYVAPVDQMEDDF